MRRKRKEMMMNGWEDEMRGKQDGSVLTAESAQRKRMNWGQTT
jgi:hypothetical protein